MWFIKGFLKNYNRPALFYYLLVNTDNEMKKDASKRVCLAWCEARDSQEITLQYYKQWSLLSEEEKKKYETMSEQYATNQAGETINSINARAERFFSMIHLRYIWLQNIGLNWIWIVIDRMVAWWVWATSADGLAVASSNAAKTLRRLCRPRPNSLWTCR